MSDVTAAGVPVRLTSGEIVIVTPYTNRDTMSILKLIQQKNLRNLISAIPKDLPKDLYKAAYSEAVKISKEFDINNITQTMQEMADEEILQTMVFLAIQKTYKGDASKKALELMDNPEDFNSVMSAVNGQGKEMSEEEEEGEEDTSPPEDGKKDDKNPPESVQL